MVVHESRGRDIEVICRVPETKHIKEPRGSWAVGGHVRSFLDSASTNLYLLVGKCTAFSASGSKHIFAQAILAYLQVSSWNNEDWKEVTASVRHRRVQRMPSNGREFSIRVDCASYRQGVKIVSDKKKRVIQMHAHCTTYGCSIYNIEKLRHLDH